MCREILIFNAKAFIYSWTSVIRPPVIRISLLSGCDLAMYTVYFSFISHKLLLK